MGTALTGTRPLEGVRNQNRIFASTSDLIAGHQSRFKAGVAGCACGEVFPEDSGHLLSTLHAIHLAPLVVSHVLRAGADALRKDLDPAAAAAAVSALAAMVRYESRAPQRKMATP